MSLASCHCSTPRLGRAALPVMVRDSPCEGAARHSHSNGRVKPRAAIASSFPLREGHMVSTPDQKPKKQDGGGKRQWAPRMWEGCDFFAWFRLLVRNRFAVHWAYLYIAVIVTF